MFSLSHYRDRHATHHFCAPCVVPQTLHLLHEFETLDPAPDAGLSGAERTPLIDAYWAEGNVYQRMGPGAESFAGFAVRVDIFRTLHLPELPDDTIVFGRGMWIALLCWCVMGFSVSDTFAMQAFRRFQIGFPMPNGSAYRLHGSAQQWWVDVDEAVIRQMLATAAVGACLE